VTTVLELSNRITYKVRHGFFFDAGNCSNTVLLAGTGRSGTTWLEDIINFGQHYRVMFEPFHTRNVPLLAHWNYRQYLRPSEHDPSYLTPATKILSGKLRSRWADQFNERHLVRRRLIKDIRANLILRWIREQFPQIPIILVLRHPCAVASSKMKLGWETHLGDVLAQPDLVADHLAPFVDLLASTTDTFERHILLWCVENLIPLRQFRRGEVHVCFYEDFCTHPEREVRALSAYLRHPFDPAVLTAMRKPSALSGAHSAIVSGDNMLDAWRRHIEPGQVERAIELLSIFGLDEIYDASSRPKVSATQALELFEDEVIPTSRPHGYEVAVPVLGTVAAPQIGMA
jgi:Sulfotransferase family